ncbi:metal-dependent hydrolase family protein [Amycolatopsis acidicola]|uniref:metal-dependent hydrolase family protein n=1 Tax=Amycolatopsis acidicola TaxID=2596893 RepID=UPI00140A65D4|nr:amidohydrolase family protein [Amycolatopsis acidicola]
MQRIVLTNAVVFDGRSPELRETDVLVEGETITRIEPGIAKEEAGPDTEVFDVRGRTLMPGLIDAHTHAYLTEIDPIATDRLPFSYVAHDARRKLEESLNRGYTTVRDVGGGDYGLAMAVERGLINGPRVFYCGPALSQTGGHGDMRPPGEVGDHVCGATYHGHVTQVVDGPHELRRVIREQIRNGASFIKLMVSGGVASPGDDLTAAQYSDEEILAAVDETRRSGKYVTAHVHPDDAVRRAIELGIPCLEHASLITAPTAALAAETGTNIVPTLAVIFALQRFGADRGFPQASLDKLARIQDTALAGVETMVRAGVTLGLGSDLLGSLDRYQTLELESRGKVQPAPDVLASATSVNAGILGAGDVLGRVEVGYLADLIVVDGRPTEDLSVLDDDGSRVDAVLKNGSWVKRRATVPS